MIRGYCNTICRRDGDITSAMEYRLSTKIGFVVRCNRRRSFYDHPANGWPNLLSQICHKCISHCKDKATLVKKKWQENHQNQKSFTANSSNISIFAPKLFKITFSFSVNSSIIWIFAPKIAKITFSFSVKLSNIWIFTPKISILDILGNV